MPAQGPVERHHYTMNARVRPLLLFWISKENVGDAVVDRVEAGGTRAYSLLIGTSRSDVVRLGACIRDESRRAVAA